MAQIDNNLKKQLAKPQTWFCKYFPKRIRNVGEKEISDRQMVYDFKDGRNFEAVVTFDDVITRGITWATYADQLENLGAHVIGGIFLAKTHYKVNRQ